MEARARRTLLGVAAIAVVVANLPGTARADLSPSPLPSDAAASPAASPTASPITSTSASPTGSASSTPTLSGATALPGAPLARTPVPGATASSATTTAAVAPAPLTTALGPNDGVAPARGQVDAYLALETQREAAAAAVTKAQATWTTDRGITSWLSAQQPAVSLLVAQAHVATDTAQNTTDAVIRELYQQGDAGLGAIGTVLAEGPDGFLNGLDNLSRARSVANGVAGQYVAARAQLGLALTTQASYQSQLHSARTNQYDAQLALLAAQSALAALDLRIAALDVAPPQVAVGPDGCPTATMPATLRDGADAIGATTLCRSAVRQAATPQAALAITWAFQHLGSAYACGGAGRLLPYRADCSSFVSRAYHEGAGLGTAGPGWAPSTRNMVPWDGVKLDPHYALVPPGLLRPGDLVLYDTCPQGGCPYKHVVMYLGSPDHGRTQWMVHTNACGDVAHVSAFWGFPTTGEPFLVARRVLALPGEKVSVPVVAAARAAGAAATARAQAMIAAAVWAAGATTH